MKPIHYILLCLFSLLWLPSLQAQELHKVTIQLQWKHQFEFAGFYAAIHKGYYTQRGLHVELNEYQDKMDVVEEVLSGRAEYAVYHSAIVRARLEGKPVKLLANYFKRLPLVILTSPQINDLAGLQGNRLMIATKDLNSPLLKVALENAGLQAGRDIEIVPHTFSSDPFIQGKVDAMSAFITNEPFYLEQQGIDFNIIKLSGYMRSMGELYMFTSDGQADKYPDQTRDLIEATNEGWRYALAHKEEIVDLILANYSQRKSREALLYEAEKTHEMIMPLPVPVGSIFKSLIDEIATLIMDQEGIEDNGYLQDFLFDSEVTAQGIMLTPEEKAYLSSTKFNRQLSYGWMPFNLKDKEGKIIGLSEDYWALIRNKLGIQEDTTSSPVLFAKILEAMQQGTTDLFPSTSSTKEREAYAVFSDSYEEFPIAIATSKKTEFIFNTSTLEGHVVAVGRNYSAYHLMKIRYPGINFLQVKDTREALERVMTGEALAAVDILPVLQYQVNRLASEGIKLGGVTDVQFPVQVMVRKEHARLIPLINRAIASITPDERTVIHRKWMMHKVISAPDYTFLWQILTGGVVLISIILFWNRRMAQEIIRRKQIEEQLRDSEQKFRTLFDEAPDAIFITDLNDRIIDTNTASSTMLGYKREEFQTMTIADIQAPEVRGKVGSIIRNELTRKKYFEALDIHKNGHIVPVEVRNLRICIDGQDIVLSVSRDITDRKQAEQETIKAHKIASEQTKLALVGQVAGKMAHDFNNILGIIMGNTELSLMDCKDVETKKTLELIFEQTIRGKNLTKNLVAFAKDQEPKQEFFKITEKIEMVLNLLKKDLDRIDLIKEYKTGIPELLADPGMIEHALVNLIQNSIHATSMSEHPIIIIRTYYFDNNICFEIEDNGCGIPKKYLANIYEPSFTLKGTKDVTGSYDSSIKGTGYGMANVKKYIEQHKGIVLFESVVGSSTKITISLPVIEKELTSKEKSEIQEKIVHFEKHILLVEDEPAISGVQYRILSQEPCNHKVDIANDGQAAMNLFNRNKYDLVSLDYILPGQINGMDVYHHIRETSKTIPILFISGNIEFLESIKELKKQDQYVDHQSKPCINIDYVNSINKLFRNFTT